MASESTPSTSTSTSTSQWTKPSFRPAHIEQLISGVDRYNPQNLQVLHEYLSQQLENEQYDCLANLAILKLYQFNPSDFSYDVVINILLKALTASPLPDFSLCLSLLGEAPLQILPTSTNSTTTLSNNQDPAPAEASKQQQQQKPSSSTSTSSEEIQSAGNLIDPIIIKLSNLNSLLFSAKFRQFWNLLRNEKEFDDVRDYVENLKGFEKEVREVVLRNVKGTFRSIGLVRLGEYLDLKGNDLESYISGLEGWSIQDGKAIVPKSLDNEVKATVIKEDIQLDQLTKFLGQASPSLIRA